MVDQANVAESGFAVWKLVATLVFVLLNGFFVAAEFALVKVRPGPIEGLARDGNLNARIVSGMLKRLDLYLSACQLGITVASLVLGWLAEPAIAALLVEGAALVGVDVATSPWLHPLALAIALTVVTILHMTIGEQAPKVWSIQKAQTASLICAIPLRIFAAAFKPLIWFINWVSNAMVRMVGGAPASGHHDTYDLAELKLVIASAAQAGHLTSRQRLFSENILALADLEVRHVMVPRVDVTFLTVEDALEDNLQVIRAAGHSRFPLVSPDLDKVVGLVHARDLLVRLIDKSEVDLAKLARDCPTVPDTQPLSRFILDLQGLQTGCGIVVDEHGTTVGLAFLEDAIEEIVGPIYDEFDQEKPKIHKRSEDLIEMDGCLALPEAADVLGLVYGDEADTIGGLIIEKLGRIPKKDEQIDLDQYRVTVVETTRRRVTRLRFEKPKPPSGN